ncbi:MAG: membrane protein insertase YidC, partial [Thermoanaerobaculia bacterium]
ASGGPVAGERGGSASENPDSPPGRYELSGAAPPAPARSVEAPDWARGTEQIDRVETDLYVAELTSHGAALRSWELRSYDEGPRRGGRPVVLTPVEPPWQTALLTPFEELGIGDLAYASYEREPPGEFEHAFRLDHAGIRVRKLYSFEQGSYGLRIRIELENHRETPIASRFAIQWPAHVSNAPDFRDLSLSALSAGTVRRSQLQALGRPGFLGFGSAQPVVELAGGIDWAGIDAPYFIVAVAPDQPLRARARLVALEPGKSGFAEVSFEPIEIPPGQTATREYRVYAGPKESARLLAFGSEVVRSVDLGWMWVSPLTRFFGWLLHALHSLMPNYGVAIIVLTVLVRAVTAPLTTRQMRSMERMRLLQPKIKELQAKYGDDRQKQSEEMMRLYRLEKVNPLGGCLPMFLQLPVFIGLFYALRSSIDLRRAHFFGWIDDLSTPESLLTIPGLEIPVRVLPLLMGASMVLQQRMTPTPAMDPTQARMMMTIMPIMMTVLFYQFPSGLVLYWMVSNVLAIAHQRWIGRSIQRPVAT